MKNKTNKIFSIAITAIMLLFVLAAMPTMAMAAAGESVEEAQTSIDIDNPIVDLDSSAEKEEQHVKEIIETHEKQLERLKQISAIPISAPVPPVLPAPTPTPIRPIYVYVHESYYYDLGSDKLIKEHASSLSIDIDLYDVDVDSVTVDLQLPVGITPEYMYGDIPEEIYYNDAIGELSITYDTSEMTDEWIYTTFNLPELELDPFVTVPASNVTPSYCAPFESKEVTLSLSPAMLKEVYDWGVVWLEVSGVESTEITDTTPEADYEYDGPYSASASWYYYDFDELPEHVMDVYIENDIYEVGTWFECDVEKYTGTNVEILDVTTSPAVTAYTSSYTWIDSDVNFDLDPTNYTMMHGFLEGTAYTETGEVLSGADVRISGAGYDITKITDENGRYSAMLPPWAYSVSADYGYVAYDDEYESEYYEVFVSQDATAEQNLTLYEVPTVRMKINPIDDDLTDGEISYDVTIENTGSKTESISLYGYDSVWNSTGYYLYDVLEWTFSENYFELDPGDTKVVRADAEFVGTEPLDWGKYAFEIYCYPKSDGIQGYYYLKDFFEVHGVFEVIVDADKDDYMIGETIYLGMSLTSYEGPYNIDFGIDGEYSGERWNYAKLTGLYYPADYTWTGGIPIAIPASKLMPPGDYELIVWIKDSATGQLLGEGSDRVRIEHGKIMEKITIESFE